MDAKEAIDILKGLTARIVPTAENTRMTNDAWEALAVLSGLADENERLKKSLEEWANGTYLPTDKLHAENAALGADNIRLKAEVERLTDDVYDAKRAIRLHGENEVAWSDALKKAEAELERARPLLEAAIGLGHEGGYYLDDDDIGANSVIEAALAYREAKENK